jgi:predicted PurR-regulated permease PerM
MDASPRDTKPPSFPRDPASPTLGGSSSEKRFAEYASLAAIVFLIVGCFVVLRPFLTAIVSTWPIYSKLERMLNGRTNLAATIMTLLVATVIVAPLVLLGISLVNNGKVLFDMIREWFVEGIPSPPLWVSNIPLIGTTLENYWREFSQNGGSLVDAVKDFMGNWKGWFLARGMDFGQAMIQLCMSMFIAFFVYRDGIAVLDRIKYAENVIAGRRTQRLIDVIGGTVKGVVYGILGTAVAQGILAGFGFYIAGVPFPLWLGLLTFFFSLIPGGPPLVWAPAALYLIFFKKTVGWGVFMAIWGFFVVSTVDNFLKPYLISRGSNLPFILVFMGVLGGVIAFGVTGIFIGPTLIAVGYVLLAEWNAKRLDGDPAA